MCLEEEAPQVESVRALAVFNLCIISLLRKLVSKPYVRMLCLFRAWDVPGDPVPTHGQR